MKNKSTVFNTHGFTLVELMIVVLLTGIAVIAIYRGYTAFSHSADVQEQIIEMQQNLRIGMHWLERDLRRAGMTEEDTEIIRVYNLSDGTVDKEKAADVAFLAATDVSATDFTAGDPIVDIGMDLGSGGVFAADGIDNDGDGVKDDDPDAAVAALEAEQENLMGDDDFNDEDERVRYLLSASGNTFNLQRAAWNGSDDYKSAQTVIGNVDALNFVYLDEDRDDLNPVDPVDGRTALAGPDRALIRSVQVCLVVRTTNEDLRYTNNETYRNLQDSDADGQNDIILPPAGDHFRRRIFCKEIKIRNAGL